VLASPPAWTTPLRIFALTRAGIWALAAGTAILFEERLNPARGEWDSERLHELGTFVDVWARWDSDWYLRIADGWYDWPSSTPAFFPLYPSLVALVGRILGGHDLLAGVLISLACAAAAFVLLHRLVRERWGDDVAARTVLALAVFPTSLFLGAVYSEALFLLLAVAVFLLAERGRLVEASLVVGLALLTRPQAVALVPALALIAWRAGGARRLAASLAIPVGVFALYPLVLWVSIGRPFSFLTAQRTVWDRSFDPVGGALGAARAVTGGALLEAVLLVVMVALAITAWRRLGASYGSYALGVTLLPLAFPSGRLGVLYSYPRLCLVAFPCFVAAALVLRRPALWWSAIAASSAALGVLVVRWSLWEWVA
jgi:hypothetical protein